MGQSAKPGKAQQTFDGNHRAEQGLQRAAHKAEKALDGGQRAEQGLQKAADKAPKALEGSHWAERQGVVWYAQDMAVDTQGFVCMEVVLKQLQVMCVCFEGLCYEV